MTASDRDAARGATESDFPCCEVVGEGSDAQKAREARYAEAITAVGRGLGWNDFYDEDAACAARAVLTVADAEQAELRHAAEAREVLAALRAALAAGDADVAEALGLRVERQWPQERRLFVEHEGHPYGLDRYWHPCPACNPIEGEFEWIDRHRFVTDWREA